MNTNKAPSAERVILVVEDEPLIRLTTVTALTEAGFGVLEAEHAAAAMAVLRLGAEAIHGLFTDVRMPGTMDGVMLAHEACRCWPWIRLLIASGHAFPAELNLPAKSRFIAKPYHLRDVVQHLHEMGME